ncbi:MAG: hypothetical protein AMJ59_02705 [Gammaproteobacteria bacterium SG8_31]|nr:MAG: hypothetical protein AMJ59_02705 [Gammaproteobacteria bacterium SG8_31]
MTPRAMLGPQRSSPNVASALVRMGLDGAPVCTITAGWQEREGELEDLRRHLGRPTRDLELYRRAETLFASHPDFHRAYRQRQRTLKELQRLYRRRLSHASAAYAEMMREPGDGMLVQNERRAALRALRTLDRQHLRRIERIHAAFDPSPDPRFQQGMDAQRREIWAIIADSAAVLIAGGHVEVLLNRLRLFGLKDLLGDRPIVAWSAGAMALSDRVILFHDHPPQGAGIAEISDRGLGLFPGIVPLPHAGQRLRLHDVARVSLFARRFAPARCITLDAGAMLTWEDADLSESASTFHLTRRGALKPVQTA